VNQLTGTIGRWLARWLNRPIHRHGTSSPTDLSERDRLHLVEFACSRIGEQYDLKNIVVLARYLIPMTPVPSKWRRRMLASGSGDPTRAICSTLIAQCFQSIRYPILPIVEQLPGRKLVVRIACARSFTTGTTQPDELKQLLAVRLTFADCVSYFGVFDDTAVISESDDEGAYVMAWVWV
jgi:hypothetical protein